MTATGRADGDTYRRLRWANAVLGGLHLAQAAAILALANGFAIAVTASFATGPPGTPPGEPSTLFDLAVGPAVAAFLALAAVDHLLVAAPGLNRRYERGLRVGRNLFDDRFFPAAFQRRVVAERLGIVPDEMAGGHLPALGHPAELVARLEAYRADLPRS